MGGVGCFFRLGGDEEEEMSDVVLMNSQKQTALSKMEEGGGGERTEIGISFANITPRPKKKSM